MQSQSHKIDDEKLRAYIKARPIPERLLMNLSLAPLISEDDPVLSITGVGPLALLNRRKRLELTQSEKQVLWMKSHGLSRGEIAEVIQRSITTVDSHLQKAKVVLQTRTVEHAIGLALRLGLID